MFWYKFIIFLFLLFLNPLTVYGQIISEVYPAPQSGDYEWIEIYNNTSEKISTQHLYIEDASGKKIVIPFAELDAGEYKTATSSNVLNNTDETVYLKSVNGTVFDTVQYAKTLDSTTSYSRCNTSWIITKEVTREMSNDKACTASSPTPSIISPTSTPLPSTAPSFTVSNYEIEIYEFLSYPETSQKEWVEILNKGSTSVFLDKWIIDDGQDSGGKPYTFSIEIAAGEYKAIELPTALLNNGGDTVRLLNSQEEEVEIFSYSSGKKGMSWGKNATGTFCLQEPSKERSNSPCLSTGDKTGTAVIESTNSTNKNKTNDNSSTSKSYAQPARYQRYQTHPTQHSLQAHNYIFRKKPVKISPLKQFLKRFFATATIIISTLVILLITFKIPKRYTVV